MLCLRFKYPDYLTRKCASFTLTARRKAVSSKIQSYQGVIRNSTTAVNWWRPYHLRFIFLWSMEFCLNIDETMEIWTIKIGMPIPIILLLESYILQEENPTQKPYFSLTNSFPFDIFPPLIQRCNSRVKFCSNWTLISQEYLFIPYVFSSCWKTPEIWFLYSRNETENPRLQRTYLNWRREIRLAMT
jgi:hypothetical protein